MSGRAIAVSSAFLAGQSVLLNAISLFATAYIIRKLGPIAYGEWATAAGLTAVNGAIASFGLRPLFVRAVAQRSTSTGLLLSEQLGVRLVLGLAAATVAVICAVLLKYPPVVVSCAIISSFSLLLTVTWTVFGDYLQAYERFKTYSTVSFIAGLVLTAASVAAAWAGGGAVALAWAYVTGPLCTVIMFGSLLHRRGEFVVPTISMNSTRRLLGESRSIAGSQLLATLRDRGEQLIVPKAVGIGPFGYYAGSVMPADRLNVLPDAISTAFYPRLAGAVTSEVASAAAARLTNAAVASTTAAAALLYIAAPAIANVLYPSAVHTSLEIIRVSCLAIPAAGLATAFAYALQATGQHRAVARRASWLNICGVCITIYCVWRWGISGAVWGWVLKQLVMAAGLAPQYARQFNPVRITIAKALILIVIIGILTWMIKSNDTRLLPTALRGTAAVIALAPLMWLFTRASTPGNSEPATKL